MPRILKIILLASTLHIANAALADNFSEPYSPTKAEWLELASYKAAHELVDLWKLDVSVSTTYLPKEGVLLITLSARNGQSEPDAGKKRDYIDSVDGWVRGALKRYEWASSVKVQVQFI